MRNVALTPIAFKESFSSNVSPTPGEGDVAQRRNTFPSNVSPTPREGDVALRSCDWIFSQQRLPYPKGGGRCAAKLRLDFFPATSPLPQARGTLRSEVAIGCRNVIFKQRLPDEGTGRCVILLFSQQCLPDEGRGRCVILFFSQQRLPDPKGGGRCAAKEYYNNLIGRRGQVEEVPDSLSTSAEA
jgi:hypothetical protein